MGYIALYRKFRPTTFAEIVGENHIIKTVKNQITAGRIGHAYLFSGGRGTGKTSAAKILARAVNCTEPKDGEPCNECTSCKGILSGAITDVMEMDAASNNSVEDIRKIREEVNFLPTVCKYRVYIIDEVHMLSTGAFNALLKTLEEPPAHVIFILATTEPGKLPATILSRCQRFDFKRLRVEDIIFRLKIICKESNIVAEEEALKIIAILAEGGMRDAISILERCIQDGDTEITVEKIRELAGIPDYAHINSITKFILEYKIEEGLIELDKILAEGKDLKNLLWEIIKYLRDILLFKASGKLDLYSEEEIENIKTLANIIDKQRLLDLIFNFSELENSMKWSSQPLILFQVAIIKMCSKNIKPIQNVEVAQEKSVEEVNIYEAPVKTNEPVKVIESNDESGEYVPYWRDILDNLKKSGKIILYTNLMNSKAQKIDENTLGIVFSKPISDFGKTVIQKQENMSELKRLASLHENKQMNIKIASAAVKVVQEKAETNIEDIVKSLDIEVNIIE